jgi:acetolactate synthase I/II/III large subunit
MTGAEKIAKRLFMGGCRQAFGIPGGEVLALIDALDKAGIAVTLTRHENAAGFMAEGTWHAAGAPGLFFATLGPGVANGINVVANALQDRVPLIFLTGCVDAEQAEGFTHQIFDHAALLRPIVKASLRATAATADLVIDKAFAIALSGRPGPVHVDVPINVAEGVSHDAPMRVTPLPVPAGPPLASADWVAASALLKQAKRPLLLAGLDVINQGAAQAVAEVARHLSIPLITTYKAKGILPEEDPLCLGAAGLSPKADTVLLPLLRQSDCILLAGYDPIEMRAGWCEPWSRTAPVIDIVAQNLPHGMHGQRFLFEGDVGAILSALAQGLAPSASWAQAEPSLARQALGTMFSARKTWGPHAVFTTMRAALPDHAVITADSGAHRILLSQLWHCAMPRTMLQSSGLCTMACAVPLAAGYKLARPDTPVCAFVGDAGLEMGLGELASIRDMGLPLPIVVLVDDSLSLIEMKQRGTQRSNLAVDFGATDYPALAKAMGGHGIWIEDIAKLEQEARIALTRKSFTLLACRIGRRAYDGAF